MSNQLRGAILYEYDIKTGELKNIDSKVMSEYGIGFYLPYDSAKNFVNDWAKGTLTFWEEPEYSQEAIKETIYTAYIRYIGDDKSSDAKYPFMRERIEKLYNETDSDDSNDWGDDNAKHNFGKYLYTNDEMSEACMISFDIISGKIIRGPKKQLEENLIGINLKYNGEAGRKKFLQDWASNNIFYDEYIDLYDEYILEDIYELYIKYVGDDNYNEIVYKRISELYNILIGDLKNEQIFAEYIDKYGPNPLQQQKI